MGRRLGRFAGMALIVAVCSAVLFVLPIWLFGATPVQSAMISALVVMAVVLGWTSEFLYRKSFPNLFGKFEKGRRNKTAGGDGDE